MSIDALAGSNLATLAAAPIPCKAAATWNASTGLTGTNPAGCDGSAALWADIGAVGGSALSLGQQLSAASIPVVLPAAQITTLTPPTSVGLNAGTNLIGNVGTGVYPAGSTPITASATGTTAATTATLAANASLHTYICGYSIRANATAATTVTSTITGVVTGTLSSLLWVAPAASGIGVDEQIFSPCIISSAVNTGIAVVSGAPGSGGNVTVKAWGFQL
jgi:hypothetical protein